MKLRAEKKSRRLCVNGTFLHAVSARDKSHASARYVLGGEAGTKQHYLQQSCLWMKVFGLLHAWSELKWMYNTVGNHRQKPFIVQLIVLEVVTIHMKAPAWNTNEVWTHSEDKCRRNKAEPKRCYFCELQLQEEGVVLSENLLRRFSEGVTCVSRPGMTITATHLQNRATLAAPKPSELSEQPE